MFSILVIYVDNDKLIEVYQYLDIQDLFFFFFVIVLQRNKMIFNLDKIQNRYLYINLLLIFLYFKCYDF